MRSETARGANSARLVTLSTWLTCVFVAVSLVRWAATTGMWCDELLFLRAIRLGPWSGMLVAGSSHPPLARWIAGALVPDDASDLGWRLPSIACSVLCVPVWKRILSRLFDDGWIVALLLPALALNVAWATKAYQLSPYPLLALLASLHVWSVCLVLDRPEGRSWALFVLSVALAAWTHFFGLSLIGVDVFVGVVLRATGRMERARARTWIFATLAALLLALPVFPIFEFYLRQERPYAIVEVHDRLAYALWAARSLFKATATYRVDVAPFAWLSLYVALGVLGWAAWRKPRARDASEATNPTGLADAGTRALIALAACLPGMPAAQLWSFVSGSAVFERYALTGGWAQPIALVLAWWFVFGRTGARLFAATLLAFGLVRFAGFAGVYAAETHDWTPVVEHIEKRAGPGDAYFVQDFDQWTGPAAFDGLWNERYGRGLLGLVHGAPLRRAAIPREGLTLDSAPAEVRRLWVFSHLFASEWLEHMPREHAAGWRLRELTVIGRAPPLALFERAD